MVRRYFSQPSKTKIVQTDEDMITSSVTVVDESSNRWWSVGKQSQLEIALRFGPVGNLRSQLSHPVILLHQLVMPVPLSVQKWQ